MIELPSHFVFSMDTSVRVTDLNYGAHLSHVSTVGLLHNARVLFLKSYHFTEGDIDGLGLILKSGNYEYQKEKFFDDTITIRVGIGTTSRARFTFVYLLGDSLSKDEVMRGEEEFIFFDYEKRKPSRIPKAFSELCAAIQKEQEGLL